MCVCVCVCMRGRACLYVRSFVRVCCIVSLIILSREEFVVFTGMFVLRAVGEGCLEEHTQPRREIHMDNTGVVVSQENERTVSILRDNPPNM